MRILKLKVLELEIKGYVALLTLSFLFEPRDLWIGLYWSTTKLIEGRRIILYICIIPTFCIKIPIMYYKKDLDKIYKYSGLEPRYNKSCPYQTP